MVCPCSIDNNLQEFGYPYHEPLPPIPVLDPLLYSAQSVITLAANRTIAKTGDSILFTGTYIPNQDLNIYYWVNRTLGPHEHVIKVRTDCDGQFKCVAILPSDAHNEQDQLITGSSILRFQACTPATSVFSLLYECGGTDVSNEVRITVSPGTPINATPSTYTKNYPANSTYSGSAVVERIHAENFKYFDVAESKPISIEEALFNILMGIETTNVQKGYNPLTIKIDYNEDALKYYFDIEYTYVNTNTVKITPSADTYVSSGGGAIGGDPNTNYGSSNGLQVGIQRSLFSGTGYKETLIRFPLSDIPPGSTINSTKLYLSCTSCPDACSIWQIRNNPVANRTWTETGVTWNTRPVGDSTFPGTTFQGSQPIDLTCYVNDMYNQGIDADFTIGWNGYTCVGYGGTTTFASKEYSDTSKIPYIEVEYSPKIMSMVIPAVPFATIAFAVLVVIGLALAVWALVEISEIIKSPAGALLGGGIGILLLAGGALLLLSQAGKIKGAVTAAIPKQVSRLTA